MTLFCWFGNKKGIQPVLQPQRVSFRGSGTNWSTCNCLKVDPFNNRKTSRPNEVQNKASTRAPIYFWPCMTLTFDLLHPSCCDTIGIYHNMCLPGLVKSPQFFLRNLTERDLATCSGTATFDLLTPISCHCHVCHLHQSRLKISRSQVGNGAL